MPTLPTSSPRFSCRSRFARVAPAAMLFALSGSACSNDAPSSETPATSQLAYAANLLTNGSFESGLSPWFLNINHGAGTFVQDTRSTAPNAGAASGRLSVTKSVGNIWDLAVIQQGLPVTGNQKYTVSFYAKASSSGRQALVALAQAYSPYTNYYTQAVTLSTTWQKYSFTFTQPVSDSHGELLFASGQQNGKMWLDAVSVTPEQAPAPALSYSPASLDFGSVAVGTASGARTLTMTNSGGSNLVISTSTLSGDFRWGPVTPTTCVLGGSIAPGASCTMAISFAPQTAGALTGTLTLTDSAANSPQAIPLTGSGGTATAPPPPPAPGASPFLGLSFQGLSLNIGARTYSGGGWTDIVGTDSVYGNSSPRYPAALWGGTAPAIDSLQMIWNSPSDITRQIVTDTSVPPGVSNRVLESTFVNPYVSPTQDNFQFFPDLSAPQGMVYFSKWMWLQPDLLSRGPFWFEFNETKTNGNGESTVVGPERFGVGLNLASWTGNQIVWGVTHDAWVNGAYQVYADALLSPSSSSGPMVSGQTNYAPIPLGQWFRVESAWNRSMNGTGWIWMALTVPGSSDPNLQKGVQVFAQSGKFNFTWNGVTQTVGWNKATNDPINRVFPFGAYSDLVRSPASTYAIRQTNIETWSSWPSTASPHPLEFQ